MAVFKEVKYEVFACSAYGSDVYETYDLDNALKQAQEWSMNSKDVEIIINQVLTQKIKIFKNGKEIA